MRFTIRSALLLVLLAAAFVLAGCEPGDETWLACLFGDKIACNTITNGPPTPGPIVPGPPAAPAAPTVRIVGAGISLDWTRNTESDVTGYTVYRGTFDQAHQGGIAYSSVGDVTASEFVDAAGGLVTGTTYWYVLTARDSEALESPRSSPAVPIVYCDLAHICPHAPGPPAAPIGLVPVLQDATGITLDWNDNTEPDLDRYFVYRTVTAGSYGPALYFVNGDTSETSMSASVYGLEPFTQYFFSVSALDDDGDGLESPKSNEAQVRFCPSTLPDCPQPPGAVTGLRLVSRESRGISVAWEITPGTNVARYAVYVARGIFPPKLLRTTTGQSVLDPAPDATFTNHYTVAAVDADGHQGARSAPLDVDWCGQADPQCTPPAAPAQPTGLTATPQPFAMSLDWNDNHESNLLGYDVEFAFDAPGPPWNLANDGPVTVSQFRVIDLPASRTAYYRVTAIDTAHHRSTPSAVVPAAACGVVCPPAGAARLQALAARRDASVFKLVLSAAVTKEGTRRLEGGQVVGTGDALGGTFELKAAPAGLDPALKRLAAKGLGGAWKATVDWRLDPDTHTGTSTTTGLASFADPALGKACLRLTETYSTQQTGKRPPKLVTHGTYQLLGGTASAPKLFADGTYTGKVRRDGTLVRKGTTDRSRTVPPGIPADCAALDQ